MKKKFILFFLILLALSLGCTTEAEDRSPIIIETVVGPVEIHYEDSEGNIHPYPGYEIVPAEDVVELHYYEEESGRKITDPDELDAPEKEKSKGRHPDHINEPYTTAPRPNELPEDHPLYDPDWECSVLGPATYIDEDGNVYLYNPHNERWEHIPSAKEIFRGARRNREIWESLPPKLREEIEEILDE